MRKDNAIEEKSLPCNLHFDKGLTCTYHRLTDVLTQTLTDVLTHSTYRCAETGQSVNVVGVIHESPVTYRTSKNACALCKNEL